MPSMYVAMLCGIWTHGSSLCAIFVAVGSRRVLSVRACVHKLVAHTQMEFEQIEDA